MHRDRNCGQPYRERKHRMAFSVTTVVLVEAPLYIQTRFNDFVARP